MCPMSRRSILLLIFLLALVLRLVVVLAATDLSIGLDDMFQYDMLARSIVSGNGYRWYAQEDLPRIRRALGNIEMPSDYDPQGVLTSHRAPAYPVFLALIYAVTGIVPERLLAARLIQAVVGAALAPLTWLLGRRMGLADKSSAIGAAVIAAYPLLCIYPTTLLTENLYIPLFVLSLWALLRAGDVGRARDYVLAGLLLGVTALTRSIVSLFVPLAALRVWLLVQPRRSGLRLAILLLVSFLAVVTPWSVRNTLLHGEFCFIETSLGYNLYMGYHPINDGGFDVRISTYLLHTLDDAERNRQGMEAAWSFIRSDPGRVPYLMVRKLAYFLETDKRGPIYFYANNFLGHWPGWQLAGGLLLVCGPFLLVASLGLAGLALARPWREVGLVVLLIAYYVGVHMLISADSRYHLPLVPLLALWAAQMLVERPWRQARPWQKAIALTLVLGLLVVWGFELARDWDVLVAIFGPEGHSLYLEY